MVSRMIRSQNATPIAVGCESSYNPNEWEDPNTEQLIDFIRVHISQIGVELPPAAKSWQHSAKLSAFVLPGTDREIRISLWVKWPIFFTRRHQFPELWDPQEWAGGIKRCTAEVFLYVPR